MFIDINLFYLLGPLLIDLWHELLEGINPPARDLRE